MEDLQPIPLIKAFLMKYVDEAEFQRRQSHTEDDNPPSPQNVSEDTGMKFPTPHTPPISWLSTSYIWMTRGTLA